MFKTLAFASMAVASVQAIIDPLDTFTCTTTLADKTTFQLMDLYADAGYTKLVNGNSLVFNYCTAFVD